LSKKEPISEHNTNKTDNPSSKPHEDKIKTPEKVKQKYSKNNNTGKEIPPLRAKGNLGEGKITAKRVQNIR